MTRLADLPVDLERIIATKRALLSARGHSAAMKAERERDIKSLELARRICAFVARHPYDFRQWYATATGGELPG